MGISTVLAASLALAVGGGASMMPAATRAGVRSPARPATASRTHRLVYENLAAYRYNPLGLLNQFRVGWRARLYRRPQAVLHNQLDVKLHSFITPAFSRVGPMVEIQPLAVLRLSANYTLYAVYGTFGLIQSYDSPRAEYSPALRRAGDGRGENYGSFGQQAELSATVRGELGPVAARSVATFQYAKLDLTGGDTVFYDRAVDLLQPNGGWAVTNDIDVFYRLGHGLILAGRYSVGHAFFRRGMYRPGEPRTDPNGTTQRLGPALVYRMWERPGARVDEPTIIVLAQWWLQHRYRAGQHVPQAIPYLAVAFTFKGDLLR